MENNYIFQNTKYLVRRLAYFKIWQIFKIDLA